MYNKYTFIQIFKQKHGGWNGISVLNAGNEIKNCWQCEFNDSNGQRTSGWWKIKANQTGKKLKAWSVERMQYANVAHKTNALTAQQMLKYEWTKGNHWIHIHTLTNTHSRPTPDVKCRRQQQTKEKKSVEINFPFWRVCLTAAQMKSNSRFIFMFFFMIVNSEQINSFISGLRTSILWGSFESV